MMNIQLRFIFIIPVLFLITNLKGQVANNNNYKNSVAIEIGSFVMVNYYRQLVYKNKYTLNGQFGVGSFFKSKNKVTGIIGALNTNAYINNLFSIKKHIAIIGFGGQANKSSLKFICKVGYQYNVMKRLSLNVTLYQWLWERHSFANQEGDGNIVVKNWVWNVSEYDILFSFGINFYF